MSVAFAFHGLAITRRGGIIAASDVMELTKQW